MKYFRYTYYLLLICMVVTSCTTDVDDIVHPDQTKEEVRVQLNIQFPETATRGNGTDEGTPSEQMINNVHLYIFESNGGTSYFFKEEASVIAIGNTIGKGARTIYGMLSETYSRDIKIVALANLDNKGLDFSSLPTDKGTSISSFYSKLIFSRTNVTQWPSSNESSLPMWGECTMSMPKAGNNPGNLSLTRAIAKVNVLVNGGQGIAGKEFFKIAKVEVCQYNDRGYCAPQNGTSTEPYVPTDAKTDGASLIYENSTPSYDCKDRIYIPEQKNIGVTDDKQKVFLKLTATIDKAGKKKEFRINFKKDGIGADFNVLRNNMYVFNIKSVKIEEEVIVSISLTYTVVEWGNINIDVPSFE